MTLPAKPSHGADWDEWGDAVHEDLTAATAAIAGLAAPVILFDALDDDGNPVQITALRFEGPGVQIVGSTMVVTVGGGGETPATAPGAPGTPTATGGDGTVALTWTAPSSNGGSPVTDYTIRRSSNGGTSWTTLTDGTSTATSYTDATATNGTSYVYAVAAVNAAGTSAWSASSAPVTPAAPPGGGEPFSFTDDFNRADADELGAPWTKTLGAGSTGFGAVGVSDNAARIRQLESGSVFYTIDAGTGDVTLTATVTSYDGLPAFFFAVRYSSPTNYFAVERGNCIRYADGAPFGLGAFSQTFTAGDTISIVCSGPDITIKRNGTTVATYSDSFNQSATRHGFIANTGETGTRYDTFSLESN